MERSRSSTARQSKPSATPSRRRVIVDDEGSRAGRKEVLVQLPGAQAQEIGRSCKAAHSMVTTNTQPGICTYFWEKSRAVAQTVRYNKRQSSRSMACLLSNRPQL